MKKILVSIPDKAWKIAEKHLKGVIGESDSEVIRVIFIDWLESRGYLDMSIKRRRKEKGGVK
jgi:hypothetical protein